VVDKKCLVAGWPTESTCCKVNIPWKFMAVI
jgi:hypothetical protein